MLNEHCATYGTHVACDDLPRWASLAFHSSSTHFCSGMNSFQWHSRSSSASISIQNSHSNPDSTTLALPVCRHNRLTHSLKPSWLLNAAKIWWSSWSAITKIVSPIKWFVHVHWTAAVRKRHNLINLGCQLLPESQYLTSYNPSYLCGYGPVEHIPNQ